MESSEIQRCVQIWLDVLERSIQEMEEKPEIKAILNDDLTVRDEYVTLIGGHQALMKLKLLMKRDV